MLSLSSLRHLGEPRSGRRAVSVPAGGYTDQVARFRATETFAKRSQPVYSLPSCQRTSSILLEICLRRWIPLWTACSLSCVAWLKCRRLLQRCHILVHILEAHLGSSESIPSAFALDLYQPSPQRAVRLLVPPVSNGCHRSCSCKKKSFRLA